MLTLCKFTSVIISLLNKHGVVVIKSFLGSKMTVFENNLEVVFNRKQRRSEKVVLENVLQQGMWIFN